MEILQLEKIEELRNQNAELRDELEVKNAELNKEKEKNKELVESNFRMVYDAIRNEEIKTEDYISKFKIKAKIEEAKKIIDEKNFCIYTETQYIKAVNQLEILESLLKEK